MGGCTHFDGVAAHPHHIRNTQIWAPTAQHITRKPGQSVNPGPNATGEYRAYKSLIFLLLFVQFVLCLAIRLFNLIESQML